MIENDYEEVSTKEDNIIMLNFLHVNELKRLKESSIDSNKKESKCKALEERCNDLLKENVQLEQSNRRYTMKKSHEFLESNELKKEIELLKSKGKKRKGN